MQCRVVILNRVVVGVLVLDRTDHWLSFDERLLLPVATDDLSCAEHPLFDEPLSVSNGSNKTAFGRPETGFGGFCGRACGYLETSAGVGLVESTDQWLSSEDRLLFVVATEDLFETSRDLM